MTSHAPFLDRVALALAAFRGLEHAKRQLTLAALEVFVEVARKPASTQDDIARALGISQTVTTRTVAALSEVESFERHVAGKPGMGLVEAVTDPRKRNTRRLFLTLKGREVAREMGGSARFETISAEDWLASLTPKAISQRGDNG